MNESLRDREAAIFLDRLAEEHGKLPIDLMTDALVEGGYIPDDSDAFRNWQRSEARRIAGRCRKYRARSGETQMEMVNLVETLDDGSKAQYYKRVQDLDVTEAATLLKYWHTRERYDSRQKRRYAQFLFPKFGKKLERAIGMDIYELL